MLQLLHHTCIFSAPHLIIMLGFFVWGLMVVIDNPRTQSSYTSIFTYGILVVYGVIFVSVSCFAGSVHFRNYSNKENNNVDNIDNVSKNERLGKDMFSEKINKPRVDDNHSKIQLNRKEEANVEPTVTTTRIR